ncbi:MAG: alpha/beta fold hydrolase [Thermodesulfobacteriota bacterium]
MKHWFLIPLVWMCAFEAHGALVEEIAQVPVEVTDMHWRTHRQTITLTVFRDDSPGKSPFLILHHGRAVSPSGRAKLERARYAAISSYFVGKGFAVFVPTRIGYGATGGPDVEYSGACDRKNYVPGYEAGADQSLAVIEYAKSRSYVDAHRGIVLGQSFGGVIAVALAARNIGGVLGAINFAGGGGGDPETRPGEPCSEYQLKELFADYGKKARTPMLWLYSENDRYFGSEYPPRWFDAFKKQGGVAQYIQLPAHGKDGHGSFTSNPNAWKPHVKEFLKSLGLSF